MIASRACWTGWPHEQSAATRSSSGGVLLRMEQAGFRRQRERNYQGASYGWQRFLGSLERVVAALD